MPTPPNADPPPRGELFSRATALLGPDACERLRNARIILFGVGGVGSWAAEALVRTGAERLDLVDDDVVRASNVNRQAPATSQSIGELKVEAMRARLLAINPRAAVGAFPVRYDRSTCGRFRLGEYDYVIDAIDSLSCKVLLLRNCAEAGATVFSSMGAAEKTDPTLIRTAPLGKTRGCPLARLVRKRLRRQGVRADFLCVYSEEPPAGAAGSAAPEDAEEEDGGASGALAAPGGARARGSLAHVTAPFGFALAGLVVRDAARAAGSHGFGRGDGQGVEPVGEHRAGG